MTNNDPQARIALAEAVLGGQKKLKFYELQALAEELKQDGRQDHAAQVRSLADANKRADEERAVKILSNEGSSPEEMLKLAKRLAGEYKQFGYARRLLNLARETLSPTRHSKIYLETFQKSAVYTYKDVDLPAAWRLDRAFKILESAENLATTRNKETLGIAGAIYKRKWELDGQRHHLERSLHYYLKGYAQGTPEPEQADIFDYLRDLLHPGQPCVGSGPGRADILGYLRDNPDVVLNAEEDQGYTGINAAFILDLLAQQEEEEAKKADLPSETSNRRREEARRIRLDLIRSVPPLVNQQKLAWLKGEWWFYATVGEAYFGLDRYDEALDWLLAKPREAGLLVPEWEYESTAQQLTRLALLKHGAKISEEKFEETATGQALRRFLRDDEKKVRSAFLGKFGLALSGGGFRASLYHVGVLAKLAELDVLRHVEVLSCVSGGSIVGAYYYLELRKLLEGKEDDDISRQDYVDLVKRVEQGFLAGVQRNIRGRVFAEFTTNLKMIFWPGYSRTRRVGELYERELFSRIVDEPLASARPDGELTARIKDGRGRFQGWRWVPDWLARRVGLKREYRYLKNLYIYPLVGDGEWDEDFYPKRHNWKRNNKVPVLILNATSLNTGHVWQFTGSYMGEPPNPVNSKIDSNYRFRRMYHKEGKGLEEIAEELDSRVATVRRWIMGA